MLNQRSSLMLVLLALLVVIPATAGEVSADGEAPVAAVEVTVVEATEGVEAPKPLAELRAEASASASAPDLSVMNLLGVVAPQLVESSTVEVSSELGGYYPGYCYHDCSTCYSRDDCLAPGFPIGFPCTSIPLC